MGIVVFISVIEISVGIICCCAPSLQPLFQKTLSSSGSNKQGYRFENGPLGGSDEHDDVARLRQNDEFFEHRAQALSKVARSHNILLTTSNESIM